MPNEKPNIYPPGFPDPLLPTPGPGSEGDKLITASEIIQRRAVPLGGEGAAKDAYLGSLAKEALADPGVPPDGAPPAPDAPTSPPPAPPPAVRADAPIDVLRGIAIGTIDPGTDQAVRGAAVEYCPRSGQWRPAFVHRVRGIDTLGHVLVDLTSQTVGGGDFDVFESPLGSAVGNWRFPLA